MAKAENLSLLNSALDTLNSTLKEPIIPFNAKRGLRRIVYLVQGSVVHLESDRAVDLPELSEQLSGTLDFYKFESPQLQQLAALLNPPPRRRR